AYKLGKLIEQRKLSPVELLDAIFRRIEELNPKLNAYLTLAQEQAYEAVREAERRVVAGDKLGPLHGIPTSIKDLNETGGIRTTFGSLVYCDHIPQTEGVMMKRLKAAGAIIIGKTNTPEFGLALHTENRLGEPCRNPWNTERTPGGSSGGAAAAAAAGISPLTQGSDGGGSIRVPASFSGIFGLKPTFGRIPVKVRDWGTGNFGCLGPLSRNVRDAAMMLNVMAGPDRSDYSCIRTSPPDYLKALDDKPRSLRIGWSPDLGYGVHVDSEVTSAVENAVKAFENMGHTVEEAAPKMGSPFYWGDINQNAVNGMAYREVLEKHPEKLTDYAKKRLQLVHELSGIEITRSWIEVEKMKGAMLDFFEKYDLLMCPTTATPAFRIGQRDKSLGMSVNEWPFCPFTIVFNLTQNPGASVPCGISSDGLPIGLQIVGRLQDEVTVLQAAAAFEQAHPWADKYPPVS
ncbi:amidase, partial [Chloroflexota bacterium]